MTHAPENRLKNSASPYLRSAAHQPIDWNEWGEEAFAKARAEGKPVLLDIGAVWCHWCHVIDRESYENPEIAAMINNLYIPVKVDRDERPDVDARYQSAVSAISGQGGWPLTDFLTRERWTCCSRDTNQRAIRNFCTLLNALSRAWHWAAFTIRSAADFIATRWTSAGASRTSRK